jgi:hypothetical protein
MMLFTLIIIFAIIVDIQGTYSECEEYCRKFYYDTKEYHNKKKCIISCIPQQKINNELIQVLDKMDKLLDIMTRMVQIATTINSNNTNSVY